MFVCAGESEQFDFARPIGIGMVEAGINLARLCERERPDSLVFVGTAGSYGNKEIFDIIESAISTNIENGFFDGKSYTPIENVVETVAYGGAKSTTPKVPSLRAISSHRLLDGSHVSRETIVNSSNYITIDPVSAEQFLANGIELENMEFYAVLKAAEHFGIPAHGIFVVTNYCNAFAHDDFVSNQAEAMKRLTKYIEEKYA